MRVRSHSRPIVLDISSVKNDLDRQGKQHRHYKFDMTARPQEHAQASSVKQRDPDAVSDTGTYTIDDDGEPVQNIKRNPTSSILKRYVSETKARHGTFELQGKIPTRSHPVVDVNIPTRDLRSPTFSDASSGSSIHSIEDEIHLQSPATPLKSNPVRPAECFGKRMHHQRLTHIFSICSHSTHVRNQDVDRTTTQPRERRHSMEV